MTSGNGNDVPPGAHAGVAPDAVVEGVDVDAVAAAVLGCSTVSSLSGGLVGEVATYLPGRRVRGIVVRAGATGTTLDVHVVGVFGPTMAEIATQVHAAAGGAAPTAQLSVFIDDLAADPRSRDLPPTELSPPNADGATPKGATIDGHP